MRKEYDLTKMKLAQPKYLKLLKESVTMRLDIGVVNYFKKLSDETGMPYQSLINYILREYADQGLKPSANWKPSPRKASKKKAG
jgi:uncharacterized protein (DUF4415 family)